MQMKKCFISLAMALATAGSLGCSEAWQEDVMGGENRWVDSTEIDPMTDEVAESVSFASNEGLEIQVFCYKPKRQLTPSLAIRFATRTHFFLGPVESVQLRIDKGEVRSQNGSELVGRAASALIDEISSGELLLVRAISDEGTKTVDYSISLLGFKQRLDEVLSFCPRFPRVESPPTGE